jgi:hypothetical protein
MLRIEECSDSFEGLPKIDGWLAVVSQEETCNYPSQTNRSPIAVTAQLAVASLRFWACGSCVAPTNESSHRPLHIASPAVTYLLMLPIEQILRYFEKRKSHARNSTCQSGRRHRVDQHDTACTTKSDTTRLSHQRRKCGRGQPTRNTEKKMIQLLWWCLTDFTVNKSVILAVAVRSDPRSSTWHG